MAATCHICGRPADQRYVNEAAGEACAHPIHWPHLGSADVARASIALDRVPWLNAEELRQAWKARQAWVAREELGPWTVRVPAIGLELEAPGQAAATVAGLHKYGEA